MSKGEKHFGDILMDGLQGIYTHFGSADGQSLCMAVPFFSYSAIITLEVYSLLDFLHIHEITKLSDF